MYSPRNQTKHILHFLNPRDYSLKLTDHYSAQTYETRVFGLKLYSPYAGYGWIQIQKFHWPIIRNSHWCVVQLILIALLLSLLSLLLKNREVSRNSLYSPKLAQGRLNLSQWGVSNIGSRDGLFSDCAFFAVVVQTRALKNLMFPQPEQRLTNSSTIWYHNH